jgi:hypothetical protein
MTLSTSYYLTVKVAHVHLRPEYRPQLDISFAPEDDPRPLACCVLSENVIYIDFGEFPHRPLQTKTPTPSNGPTSGNPRDLNQVSTEAGNVYYHSVQNLLSSCLLTKNVKIRICKTIILPVVLYMCETWSPTVRQKHKLRV